MKRDAVLNEMQETTNKITQTAEKWKTCFVTTDDNVNIGKYTHTHTRLTALCPGLPW